jgi:hypothetical protein
MGFESTIPAFQRAKTVHALDRAATVMGKMKATDLIVIHDLCLRTVVSLKVGELHFNFMESSYILTSRKVEIFPIFSVDLSSIKISRTQIRK